MIFIDKFEIFCFEKNENDLLSLERNHNYVAQLVASALAAHSI